MQSNYQDVNALLNDDEEVLLELKPNRKRYLYIGNVVGLFFGLIFSSIFLLIAILGLVGIITADPGSRFGFIIMLIAGLIPTISTIVNFFAGFKRYENHAYIVTNQRLIIRSGFIGVDFKEMLISSISSIDVRVDFLDKLVNPNTGTISFANAANPVMNGQNGRQGVSNFRFDYIENPYDVYKKIKELVKQ